METKNQREARIKRLDARVAVLQQELKHVQEQRSELLTEPQQRVLLKTDPTVLSTVDCDGLPIAVPKEWHTYWSTMWLALRDYLKPSGRVLKDGERPDVIPPLCLVMGNIPRPNDYRLTALQFYTGEWPKAQRAWVYQLLNEEFKDAGISDDLDEMPKQVTEQQYKRLSLDGVYTSMYYFLTAALVACWRYHHTKCADGIIRLPTSGPALPTASSFTTQYGHSTVDAWAIEFWRWQWYPNSHGKRGYVLKEEVSHLSQRPLQTVVVA